MNVVKAPNAVPQRHNRFNIFLAGTIGSWRGEVEAHIAENEAYELEFQILNPDRADWDSSWMQTYDDPQFFQQVSWELDAMEDADVILLHLVGGSKSPISLLELGMCLDSGKLVVSVEEDYYRKGNVDIVCACHRVPVFNDVIEATTYIMGHQNMYVNIKK